MLFHRARCAARALVRAQPRRALSSSPKHLGGGAGSLEPVGENKFGGSKLITSPFEIICNDPAKVASVLAADASRIRNFSIIAHIDHGKSTLADRMLEFSGNLQFSGGNKQVLDFLEVEKQRGITVKAQTASMFFQHQTSAERYLLNLIDTPGHVDFSYEVSRSLAACQGVLLLVDATQGVQAQTLANFYLALEAELDIVPVISKMDLPTANADAVAVQMENAFGVDRADIIRISAKTGVGVAEIFPQLIRRIRAPPEKSAIKPARMLLFDSWFDQHRGVIAVFKIVEGELKKGDFIASYHSGAKYEVSECGLLMPHRYAVSSLKSGQVGYVVAGIKSSRDVRTGDTFYACDERDKTDAAPTTVQPLPGFKPAKSMVYAGLYPVSADEFEQLNEAILKLTLNDASVSVEKESSVALGQGFRCGFLGVLHMEVFHQRLEDEFGASVIATAPTVPYQCTLRDGSVQMIANPASFPEPSKLTGAVFNEPIVKATIVAPQAYLGSLLELCQAARGVQLAVEYLNTESVLLKYTLPLNEILADFYSQVKSLTAGFASFDYEEAGTQESEICKVEILINGKSVDALAVMCHKSRAEPLGRKMCGNLKEVIERQNFEIVIQARYNKAFVAREVIKPYRKDVLSRSGKTVGGGDKTRKMKLLEVLCRCASFNFDHFIMIHYHINKQKEGKKRMRMVGDVELTQEAFLSVLKST